MGFDREHEWGGMERTATRTGGQKYQGKHHITVPEECSRRITTIHVWLFRTPGKKGATLASAKHAHKDCTQEHKPKHNALPVVIPMIPNPRTFYPNSSGSRKTPTGKEDFHQQSLHAAFQLSTQLSYTPTPNSSTLPADSNKQLPVVRK